MGVIIGRIPHNHVATERHQKNNQIDAMLKQERKAMLSRIKLLLLGAGESGKSTLVKQMRIIHKDGFTDDERLVYKKIVYSNVAESVLVLLDAMRKLVIPFQYKESKVLEKIVVSQINSYLATNSLLEPFQSAYRSLSLDSGKYVLLILLDLSAVFDTIDHGILLNRLSNFGITGMALTWFTSYLKNRYQSVTIQNITNEPSALSYGVPQGSVLGPLLFTIYITPLGELIRRHNLQIHQYADDNEIHLAFSHQDSSSAIHSMETSVRDIKQWMTYNKLQLNDNKTDVLIRSKFNHLPDPIDHINIDSVPITPVTPDRNIGVFLISIYSIISTCLTTTSRIPADERIFYKYLDTIEDKLQINVLVQQAIRRLWADKGVQSCYKRRGEYQLIDSAAYFLDNLKRISEPGYRPTDQDILRSRSATTCIVEVKFIIKGRRLDLIDVGGQRNCRRKWIHFFDDVTGVIFVASLSGYDEVLREDKNTNRLHESLSLFNVICNSKWFTTTSIILFLNKQDVFIQKLITSPVRRFLPDYTGANSFQEAAEFINLKFQQQNMSRGKKFIYSHYTTAIDTTNILFVFDACLDIIMKDNLKTIGVF
ncbi:uncharacterized protein LOC144441248 [Glandiceps talaboti]